jgi:hypothetical protein
MGATRKMALMLTVTALDFHNPPWLNDSALFLLYNSAVHGCLLSLCILYYCWEVVL